MKINLLCGLGIIRNMQKPVSQAISIRVSDRLFKRLLKWSDRSGVSMAQFIREVLTNYAWIQAQAKGVYEKEDLEKSS